MVDVNNAKLELFQVNQMPPMDWEPNVSIQVNNKPNAQAASNTEII